MPKSLNKNKQRIQIHPNQAQQLTGIFLSLSTSKPKIVQPIVSPKMTSMMTYPLYVMISIMVRMCIKLQKNMQQKLNRTSPWLLNFCYSSFSSPQSYVTSKLSFFCPLKSWFMTFVLTDGRRTERRLIMKEIAIQRIRSPTSSSRTVNLSLFVLTVRRRRRCSNPSGLSCAQFFRASFLAFDNNIMEKQSSKGIVLKAQIKKQRIAHYPYHIVTTTYSHEPDFFFIIGVDYALDSTVLSIYPFDKDMNKLIMCGITINNILTKKAVSVIHIISLKYKPIPSGVILLEAQFILGHRSGQLAVVHYKDKDCKMIAKLNRSLKGEGILSKTSSFFFGQQQSYSVHLKEPIKQFKVNSQIVDLRFSYQVGNQLIFMKNINEQHERSLFQSFEANTAQAYAFHYDLNTVADKGNISIYGNNYYYSLKDNNKKTAIIKFNYEVSSYEFLKNKEKHLAVALGIEQSVLLLDTDKFTLKSRITTEMTIRRLSCFNHQNQDFLGIMFYDNYVVLYQLKQAKYCKLIGHRSFVANLTYCPQLQMVVTGGMDHRISLAAIKGIGETKWTKANVMANQIQIEETHCETMRFPDIYSLGEYNNVRTNLHSYGFGDIFLLNGYYCLPTYDSKIMVYKYC